MRVFKNTARDVDSDDGDGTNCKHDTYASGW